MTCSYMGDLVCIWGMGSPHVRDQRTSNLFFEKWVPDRVPYAPEGALEGPKEPAEKEN